MNDMRSLHTVAEPAEKMLTVAEVAMRCHCSAHTIRRRIAAGELPAVQLGGPGTALRVPAAALNSWLWSAQEGTNASRR
jgi:excisionase family DNA binding protein